MIVGYRWLSIAPLAVNLGSLLGSARALLWGLVLFRVRIARPGPTVCHALMLLFA